MTEVSSIFVRLSGQDVGLSTLLTQVDQKTQRSADSAARMQAQYARLAATQGNTAQSTAILSNALQNNGGASERVVVSLSQQLATMQRGGTATQQLATATQGLGSTLGQLGGQLSSLGGTAGSVAGSLGQLAGSFGTLGGIGAAIGLSKVVVDLSVAGANADLLRQRFDALAVSAGTTGQALIAALRSASGGEISDLNLTLAANKAQLLGVADSAEEFGTLMAIARDRAQAMGISTTQAFDNLTTGLGRGSALILDNLGLIVSVKEANETYAASLGKTASALTEAEQKQALINAVLAQGRASMDASGGAVESNAGSFARFSANLDNTKNSVGSFLSGGLVPLANQFSATAEATSALVGWVQQLGTVSAAQAAQTTAETAATAAYSAELERSGSMIQANTAYEAALAAAMQQSTDIEQQRASALAQSAAVAEQANAASLRYADSMALGTVQANAAAQAAQQKSNADQVAAVDSQTHALAQQQLAQQAQAAAQALLAGGQAGANTAALLANSSSQVDVLTAAYYRLAAAQAAANASKINAAALASQRSGERNPGTSGVAEAAAQEQARLNAIYKRLVVPEPKGRAAGSGGGVRLSDQQKLNNTLLNDQDKANAQYEDAERTHQERLLKIAIDYAKKTLEQQKLNEVSKRQSQADFYDRLTSSDLNKKKGGTEALQAIDAEYQAAYQKSQELAQQGNAKLAADYLALKSKQTADELTYQEQLAKAREEKDQAEISRLQAIHKLRQDAAAEEEKQLLAGGDANVTAKEQALQAESDTYAANQEKIGLASDRTTERQIANAVRAGKAIDTTTLAIERQRQAYEGIGAAPGTSGGAPAAGTPTPETAPPAAPSAPSDVVAALNAAQAAIVAALGSVKSAADGTTSAVGRLAGKFAN